MTSHFPRFMQRAHTLCCALVVLLCVVVRPASAQHITAEIASQQAYVGEPVRVALSIENAPEFDGPFVGTVDGLDIARLPGEQTSTRLEFINGRRAESRSVRIAYEITPNRVGHFTVPPFTITVNGKELATKPLQFNAVVSETGDLILASVNCEPKTMYVGQEGALNLEIAVKRYREAKLAITLDEASLWSLIGKETSSWGAFGPALQKMLSENRRPRGESRIIGDTEYTVFTISKPFDPIAPGIPVIGDVRVRMDYPTKLARGNDLFFENRLSLAGSRPISVVPTVTASAILSPPTASRPASWNGAVGDFSIEVTAKPLEVAVGDPITLTIQLTDGSAMASLSGLQPPMLADAPGFLDEFRVPREAASGTIDGRSKVFTQSIRAAKDTVQEIPPIEYSFFNPTSNTYETVSTKPIALSVKPSASAKLNIEHALPAAAPSEATGFTKVEGGLLANASVEECATSSTLSAKLLFISASIPIAVALAPILLARVRRTRNHSELKHAHARRVFERAIEQCAPASGEANAPALERALLIYIQSRVRVEGDGFGRKDAIEHLEALGLDAALVASLDELLRNCERASYANACVDLQAARALVDRLELATTLPRSAAA